MPKTITFVGAGYIAFEFAAIAVAAGAEVHIIQHNSTPLKAYDQEFVREAMSQLEARYLLSKFLDGQDTPIEYPPIPSIVFTTPKMAQVGVSVSKAQEQKKHYDIATIDATPWFSYSRLDEPVSKVKLVLEKETNLLVGATCINNEADVLINLFNLLIQQKMTYTDLTNTLFAYPSIASDLTSFYSSFQL